jgi:hypothetical protein
LFVIAILFGYNTISYGANTMNKFAEIFAKGMTNALEGDMISLADNYPGVTISGGDDDVTLVGVPEKFVGQEAEIEMFLDGLYSFGNATLQFEEI